MSDSKVYVGGDVLHRSTSTCTHANNNACAFCDFDRYYATKHGSVCPWHEEGTNDD